MEERQTLQSPDKVSTWPHLVTREAAVGLLVCASVAFFSLAYPLGLLPPADPAAGTFTAKAPWFFVGLQEMLYHLPPWLAAGVLTPLAVLFLIGFPYFGRSGANSESNAAAVRSTAALSFAVLAALLVFTAPIPFYSQAALSIVFAIVLMFPALCFGHLNHLSLVEILLAYLLVSYVMWTIIGQFLRTADWNWVWQA
ncbi:MAG: hypothetical protein WC712_10840 [Candidatus Brocadiia bacterium]